MKRITDGAILAIGGTVSAGLGSVRLFQAAAITMLVANILVIARSVWTWWKGPRP